MTPLRRPLPVTLAGFVAWAVLFCLLYGMQGLGCAWGWTPASHRLFLGGIWVGGLVAGAATLLLARRAELPTRGWRFVAVATNVAALVSIAWSGFPVLFASLCD